MTKRDYELIATALHKVRRAMSPDIDAALLVDEVAEVLAFEIAKREPLFAPALFLEACRQGLRHAPAS